VNTNKCEGLWAHLKLKTKRIYVTNTVLTDSYSLPITCSISETPPSLLITLYYGRKIIVAGPGVGKI